MLRVGCRPARVDHFERFAAAPLVNDWLERGVAEQRLEDLVFVGIDGSLHDVLAESPRGVDQHNAIEPRFGVDREHHARACKVGAHHLLHADGKGHFEVIEALGLAIADGAVSEERGEAAAAGVKQGMPRL